MIKGGLGVCGLKLQTTARSELLRARSLVVAVPSVERVVEPRGVAEAVPLEAGVEEPLSVQVVTIEGLKVPCGEPKAVPLRSRVEEPLVVPWEVAWCGQVEAFPFVDRVEEPRVVYPGESEDTYV